MKTRRKNSIRLRVFGGVQVLPTKIKEAVNFLGGFQEVIKNRKWQKVREALKLPHSSSSGAQLRSIYISYFPNCASIKKIDLLGKSIRIWFFIYFMKIKKEKRIWQKRVKYDVRKNFADSRLWFKGRFVKKEGEE